MNQTTTTNHDWLYCERPCHRPNGAPFHLWDNRPPWGESLTPADAIADRMADIDNIGTRGTIGDDIAALLANLSNWRGWPTV